MPLPSMTATIWLKYLILAKTKFNSVTSLEKKKDWLHYGEKRQNFEMD